MEELRAACLDLLDITGPIAGVDLLRLIQYSRPHLNAQATHLQEVLGELRESGEVKHSNVYTRVSTNDKIADLTTALQQMSSTLSGGGAPSSPGVVPTTSPYGYPEAKAPKYPSLHASVPTTNGYPVVKAPKVVTMKSFNNKKVNYQLDITNKTCSCPDYTHRGGPKYLCKHLKQLVVNPELYDLDPSELVEIAALIAK